MILRERCYITFVLAYVIANLPFRLLSVTLMHDAHYA